VQLGDEGVDDHDADEDDEHAKGPQSGCGARAERRWWYGPGGLGSELVAFEVHDQLVLEALLGLQVLLWNAGAVVCVVHDGFLCRHELMRWTVWRKESMP